MRWMRFTLPLLLLISPLALGQKQYTEGACLLLQQQADRFAGQPNSINYQDARRELNNHCQNPIPAPTYELNLTNIQPKVAMPAAKTIALPAAKPSVISTPVRTSPSNKAVQPVVKFDMGAMMFGLFTPFLPYIFAGLAVLLLLSTIKLIWFGNHARFLGALAEWQLHRILLRELPASYQHYRNLVIPTAKGDLTEVDHLVVSAYGIFVIEVKNYRGWIFGGEKQPKWTVQRFRSKHQFMNPLHQNYKHTEAVKYLLELVGKDSETVHSIVAFSLRAEFKFQVPNNVMYSDLVGDYINRFTQPCFSDEQLRQFSARLNMALSSRKVLSKMHLAQVRAEVKG